MKSDSFKERNRSLGFQKKSRDHLFKHKKLGKEKHNRKQKSIFREPEEFSLENVLNNDFFIDNDLENEKNGLDYGDKKIR